MRRVLIRSGLVLATVLGALALTELGFRTFGPPYDRARLERDLGTVLRTLRTGQIEGEEEMSGTDGRILHPYYAWEILAESQGVQEDYFAALDRGGVDPEDEFEVWVVGGSVARFFVVPPNGALQTGAKRFAELLEQDPRFAGRRVVVKGYGRIAMKAPQQQNLVAFYLALGMAPDLIVNLDGFNEVAVANQNASLGAHPAYPSADMWAVLSTDHAGDEGSLDRLMAMWQNRRAHDALARFGLESGLLWSRALGWWIENRLRASHARYIELTSEYQAFVNARPNNLSSRGISFEGHEERVPELIERAWFENSLSLEAISRTRGIEYMHVLQPTMLDEGSKPLTEEEIATGTAFPEWIEGCRFGYPRLRAAGERLKERGVHFVDASRVFADVALTVYYDPCHYNVAGNWVLGEFMAKAYLAGLDGER